MLYALLNRSGESNDIIRSQVVTTTVTKYYYKNYRVTFRKIQILKNIQINKSSEYMRFTIRTNPPFIGPIRHKTWSQNLFADYDLRIQIDLGSSNTIAIMKRRHCNHYASRRATMEHSLFEKRQFCRLRLFKVKIYNRH